MEITVLNTLHNPLFYVIIIAVLGGIFGIMGLAVAIYSFIRVAALEKSTHQVTYMPIDPSVDAANSEWATSESALDEQNKLFTEDLEDNMPHFSPTKADKKKHSY
jgi:hypothetical protein